MVSLEVFPVFTIITLVFASRTSEWVFPDDVPSKETQESLLLSQEIPSMFHKYVDDRISNGIINLTLSINGILSKNHFSQETNVIFSPISIAGVLAIVLLGAVGKTEEEIAQILDIISGVDIHHNSLIFHERFGIFFNKLSRYDSGITFANGLFIQDDFNVREAYQNICNLFYKSKPVKVNFKKNPLKTQMMINSWVSKITHSKIERILDEIPQSDTKLIIANALFFKGEWETPFNQFATRRQKFYLNGRRNKRNTIMVDMMKIEEGYFPYYKDYNLNCEIIGFPYKNGGNITMYVIVPNDSNVEALKRLENTLTASRIKRLVAKTIFIEATVLFPKMRLESFIDLKSTLKSLGVNSLFDPMKSNLGLISEKVVDSKTPVLDPIFISSPFVSSKRNRTKKSVSISHYSESFEYLRQLMNSNSQYHENPGLNVDTIVHKTFIDITETGTEAAASTSLSLTRSFGNFQFVIDVPFLFFIRDDQTDIILFWGSIYKPTPYF